VFQQVVHLVAGRIPLSEIKSRVAELSHRRQAQLSRALKHGAQKVVVRLSMADQLLHEAPVLEQSARGGDADAEQKLQRLLIELDGLLSEAETELGWPDLDERAQRRIAWAVSRVGELGTPEERSVLSSTLDSLRRARRSKPQRRRASLADRASVGQRGTDARGRSMGVRARSLFGSGR
jgi:hypothetical protein